MKLLDLLKSLNTANAVDPDARRAGDAAPQRAQLLDELGAILAVLDTPDAAPEAKADTKPDQPRSDKPDDDTASTNTRAPLLNLAAIFEEEPAADSEQPLLFMPVENAASPAPEERRQLVQSLLDELLPALEKALDDRLNQLDHHTLRRLEQAFTQQSR